jgi:hypothetical protein
LSGISKVLKAKNGKFLSLTFAQPHFRQHFLSKPDYLWSVDHETYGQGLPYHCYIMTRGQPLDHHIKSDQIKSATNQNFIPNRNNSSSDSEDEYFTSKMDLSFESDDDILDT